jgi:SulP family sulfate permease
MWIYPKNLVEINPLLAALRPIPHFFLRPVYIFKDYRRSYLQPDLTAGLTVAVVLLPQAIVFALLAGLPPQMGLYSAIVVAIVGALWGSSNHLNSGPTNTASILVAAALHPLFVTGSPDYIMAAGLLAVMVGVFRLIMGLARLGMLVSFVSDSVIIGFTAGAGVLIAIGELDALLRLEFSAPSGLLYTIQGLTSHASETHWLSLSIGLGTIAIILLIKRLNPRWPSLLIGLTASAAFVWLFNLEQYGVKIIGQMSVGLPPLASLPLFDFQLIGQLSTSALAMAIIGLVEATSIARSIAGQSGQRLDSNQEFVGQGLANIATGFLSGQPCSGSFNRSALSFEAGAQTAVSNAISGLFVLVATFVLGPITAYIPRAALAGMLLLAAWGMIDRKEMARIWRGARGDAIIMIVTLLATLFLPLQFAVLSGILMSLVYYIMKTSTPRVLTVLPDETFRHFAYQPNKPGCPQLGIIKISGDLYFGAVSHIEEAIRQSLNRHPSQRYLLLRMHGVNHCDMSGIHMLESVMRLCRERGGDLFMMKVQRPVYELMVSTNFYHQLGSDHFLPEDQAIEHLFYKVLDPAICIYECEVRAFKECQNLPKRPLPAGIHLYTEIPHHNLPEISAEELWGKLRRNGKPPLIIDVREPREFKQGHIPQAQLIPLAKLLLEKPELPQNREVVLVCRSGRRSQRAAYMMQQDGRGLRPTVLRGGMMAWEAAKLLEAVGDETEKG